MSDWYKLPDYSSIDSPALLFNAHRVQSNIQAAIHMVGDASRLRPHVKTHKSAAITQLMLQAGIQAFKCATIAEADMLGEAGAPDVLLAYTLHPTRLKRFLQLQERYPHTRFSCLVDALSNAEELQQLLQQAERGLSVYIDLNTGMNRSGIAPEEALPLCRFVKRSSHLLLAGLHAYDGHIRDLDLQLRRQKCDEAFEPVSRLQQQLADEDIHLAEVIAGGSPTFPIHAQRKEVVCSPGTFVLWDRGYALGCPEQPFLPAAVLLTRVVSHPAPGLLCVDLGHKSVAAENDLQHRFHFLNAEGLEPVGQSEEHLVLSVKDGMPVPPLGTVLLALPYHICPTVALYEQATVIAHGMVVSEWAITARARKLHV